MRYELKYSIERLSFEAVMANILMHPAAFSKIFPDRQVNNIYMDTPDFLCFHQNIEGNPRRRKVRLRWYGTDDKVPEKSVLEIKHKDRELGWKESFPVDHPAINSAETLKDIVKNMQRLTSELVPTLHNQYLRSYYMSANGVFRLTIDRLQKFSVPFMRAQTTEAEMPIVVEIKYDREYAERVEEITGFMPFRQSKNSKYANGIIYLYGL